MSFLTHIMSNVVLRWVRQLLSLSPVRILPGYKLLAPSPCTFPPSLADMRPLRTTLFLMYRIIPSPAAVELLLDKLQQIHWKYPRATGILMSQIWLTMTSSETYHSVLLLDLIIKSRFGMNVISAASNTLAQATDVDQAVEAKAVVASVVAKTGTDVALPSTERLLISRNNLPINPRAPSTPQTQ